MRVLVYEDEKEVANLVPRAIEDAIQQSISNSEEVDILSRLKPEYVSSKSDFLEWCNNLSADDTPNLLALLDLEIGDEENEGIDAIKALRQQYSAKQCAIVMFTKHIGDDVKTEAYDAGANSFVKKPSSTRKDITVALKNVFVFWAQRNLLLGS